MSKQPPAPVGDQINDIMDFTEEKMDEKLDSMNYRFLSRE